MKNFRQWLYGQLYLEPATGQAMSALNKVIALTILVSIAAVILDTEETIAAPYGPVLHLIEIAALSVFVLEYGARLWIAGLYEKYAGPRGLIRYVISPLALIDLMAILPYFLTEFTDEGFMLRFVRILRLISLAKFGRYSKALHHIFDVLYEKRFELMMSLLLALSIMVVSATALYLAEGTAQPASFGSIPRAMWWAIATLTTVGYGDVYPVTPLGKVFAGISALAGIGLIALPTGILASAFNEALSKNRR